MFYFPCPHLLLPTPQVVGWGLAAVHGHLRSLWCEEADGPLRAHRDGGGARAAPRGLQAHAEAQAGGSLQQGHALHLRLGRGQLE